MEDCSGAHVVYEDSEIRGCQSGIGPYVVFKATNLVVYFDDENGDLMVERLN